MTSKVAEFPGTGVNGKIYVVRFSKFQRECFAPRILLFKCLIASLRLSGVSSQRFVAFAFAQFLKSRDRRNSECREATPRNADRPPENERQRFRMKREVTTELRIFFTELTKSKKFENHNFTDQEGEHMFFSENLIQTIIFLQTAANQKFENNNDLLEYKFLNLIF